MRSRSSDRVAVVTVAGWLAGILAIAGLGCGTSPERADPPVVAAELPAPTAGVPTAGWQDSVSAQIRASEYAVRVDGGQLTASNRTQNLAARWDATGLTLQPRGGAGEPVGLAMTAWGRPGQMSRAASAAAAPGPCRADRAVGVDGTCLRRVDADRGGLIEWWENRPDGLEHGFTVTTRPAGDGALAVELGVTGARVEVGADGAAAELVATDGRRLRYDGLVAWDARGAALTARMAGRGRAIVLTVDDRGAVYPVTIDPLITTAAWTDERTQVDGRYGREVASAGDVNQDGYDDIAVGADWYDESHTDEGAVFVYYGSASGPATTASLVLEVDQHSAYFGDSIAGADVNNDGYSDLIVGSPGYQGGSGQVGAVFAFYGSSTGLAVAPSWSSIGDAVGASGGLFGAAVANAGDVNADGYSDVIAGDPVWDCSAGEDCGRVKLFLGSSSGLGASPVWTYPGTQAGAELGESVTSAGVVDSDGFGAIAIGAPNHDTNFTDEGRVEVMRWTGTTFVMHRTFDGGLAGARFGYAIANGGDLDADGHEELVVGAPFYDRGRVFIYDGSPAGFPSSASSFLEGDSSSSWFGFDLASAGKLNGDGYGDLIVGAISGGPRVYEGSPSGLVRTGSMGVVGKACASGDFNGDGFSDALLGETYFAAGGKAWVHYGAALSPDADNDGDTISDSVEGVGDGDGDQLANYLDADSDGDTIADAAEAGDALISTPPVDTDGDLLADFLDSDSDGDGVSDADEAGDALVETPPIDSDGDGDANYRDVDADDDTVGDGVDNCQLVANLDQADGDGDGVGDACQNDADGDGVADADDTCPMLVNPDQIDTDGDGVGDACEQPVDVDDGDGDGIVNGDDNCPLVANADQADADGDGVGDLCSLDSSLEELSYYGCAAGGGSPAPWFALLAWLALVVRRSRVSRG